MYIKILLRNLSAKIVLSISVKHWKISIFYLTFLIWRFNNILIVWNLNYIIWLGLTSYSPFYLCNIYFNSPAANDLLKWRNKILNNHSLLIRVILTVWLWYSVFFVSEQISLWYSLLSINISDGLSSFQISKYWY